MKCLEYALAYLNKGLSIIPVKGLHYSSDEKDIKTPLIKWQQYTQKQPSKDEVLSWFKRFEKAGIAIVTGKVSGIVVVDFDSDEAIKFAEERGMLDTVLVKTRKGLHAYYTYPDREIRNTVNVQGLKIDIRGDGGYVVAPPTEYPGGSYKWLTDFDRSKLKPLPEIFIKQYQNNTVASRVISIAKGVTAGQRNTSCASYAGLCAYLGFTLEEAIQNCLVWNQKNDPPLPEGEVIRTVKSVYKTHFRNIRYLYHEKNLLRYPIFVHSHDRIHKNEEILYEEEYNDETGTKKRRWKVVPGHLGLPGPFDEAVLMAIFKIVSEKYGSAVRNPVELGSIRSIATTMGYNENSGKIRTDIAKSIVRLKSLTIFSENLFFNAETKKFLTDCFSIFDRVKFSGTISDEKGKQQKVVHTVYLWFSQVILKNLQGNFVSKLDFNTYFALENSTARAIYRLLSGYDFNDIEIKYSKLCAKLQLKEYSSYGEVQKQLGRAHEELLAKKVFSRIEVSKNLKIAYQKHSQKAQML